MHSSLTGTLDCLDNFLQSKLLGVTNKVLSMNTARHVCVRTLQDVNLTVLSLQDEDASADEEQQEQPLGIVVSEEDSEFEEKVCAK